MKKIDPKKIEELYNKLARETFKGDYEKYRWSGKVESSRYKMMEETLKEISKDYTFKKYIELGPGPGTWTKLFIKKILKQDLPW